MGKFNKAGHEKDKNKNTSPTDIKGKDVNQANQTNSGAGESDITEGYNNPHENEKKNKLDPMGTEVMQEDFKNGNPLKRNNFMDKKDNSSKSKNKG